MLHAVAHAKHCMRRHVPQLCSFNTLAPCTRRTACRDVRMAPCACRMQAGARAWRVMQPQRLRAMLWSGAAGTPCAASSAAGRRLQGCCPTRQTAGEAPAPRPAHGGRVEARAAGTPASVHMVCCDCCAAQLSLAAIAVPRKTPARRLCDRRSVARAMLRASACAACRVRFPGAAPGLRRAGVPAPRCLPHRQVARLHGRC